MKRLPKKLLLKKPLLKKPLLLKKRRLPMFLRKKRLPGPRRKGAVMREILRSGFAELGVPASEEAVAALERYAALLEEKNKVMNLTAIKGAEDVARLHFLDCGALLRYIRPEGKRLLDVGSGAGFPGLVLKLLAPETELTMLDSLQKTAPAVFAAKKALMKTAAKSAAENTENA